MSSQLKDISVAAGIIWRDDLLLCCLRPEGKPQAGFWEFPGGKLERGETEIRALCRELAEELRIHVTRVIPWRKVVHEYPERGIRVHLSFFHVTDFEGLPVPQEGQKLRWVSVSQARLLNFLPADKGLVRELVKPGTQRNC